MKIDNLNKWKIEIRLKFKNTSSIRWAKIGMSDNEDEQLERMVDYKNQAKESQNHIISLQICRDLSLNFLLLFNSHGELFIGIFWSELIKISFG